MNEPVRVQLRRTKGWKMPPNTVKVDRATRWGNPFRVGDRRPNFGQIGCIETTQEAVDLFRLHAGVLGLHEIEREDLAKIRGKNLACWCKIGEPCHADVLLELANRPSKDEVEP